MEFTGERFIPADTNNDELSVEHLHRYHSILPLVKGKVVLDIACGEGYGAALIAKSAKSVIGVDISTECIAHAKQKYFAQHANVRFAVGDVEQIPVEDGTIDVVVSFETIEHVSEEGQIRFIKEIKRVLKKDGLCIISTPDKQIYSDKYNHENQFHVHELTRHEFIDLLADHFNNAQLMEQGFEIVSAITPADYSGVEGVRLVNWQDKVKPRHRKYLIAIASDQPVDGIAVASVVLDTDKDYIQQVDRIIELQNEVEDRSAWALGLDKTRIENEAVINTLKEQLRSFNNQGIEALSAKVEALQQWLTEKEQQSNMQLQAAAKEAADYKNKWQAQQQLLNDSEKTIAALTQSSEVIKRENKVLQEQLKRQLQDNKVLEEQQKQLQLQLSSLSVEAKEKERLLQDLQFNFSLTRQQLSEVNNKLVTIYDSDGWRALEKYYNLKGRYLNENSAHYKIIRQTLNFLRNRKTEFAVAPQKSFENKEPVAQEVNGYDSEAPIAVRTLPYFDQPVVSIIIPVYNAWDMNVKCLDAIIANTADVAYEVILADDNSTDTTKNITQYFENIVHVRNEKNLGFLLNCNKAAAVAKGRYIHFLNNDTEVQEGWLSALVRLMENDEQAGMVGSKLIYPDGRLQEAGGIIWNDASGWNYGQGQNPDMPEFNYVKEVDYISGASMMVRRDLWDQLGGFDTRYSPAYCEDSDLAFAIRELGFKVMYQPLSVVVHYEGFSHGNEREKSEISSIKEYQVINNKKFFEKWKAVLQQDHFPNAENVFWAKDRSRHKKTLLMVDHYVPQYDKDAGSRTTFQYLELFVKLGYNIKFLGENFYKHEPYTTVLQQMGIEVLYGPWYANNWQQWFLENREKFDFIYLNRPHISIKYIDFFKENSTAKILYYGHDLHFLREQKRFELEGDEAILNEAEKWKKIESYLFENSDLILTPSTDEQGFIQEMNADYNVQLMRPYIYKTVGEPVKNFEERKDLLFVGGFGHLPNVDGVLWFVNNVFPMVQKQATSAKMIIAGSNPPNEIKALANEAVIVKGYVSDSELEQLYATCKIVIIPLRYGAGVKGKTVEAMRYGLPIVTTPFGVEGLPGEYDFVKVASDEAAFAEAVVNMYHDNQVLESQSERGIAYIKENFVAEVAEEILHSALATI